MLNGLLISGLGIEEEGFDASYKVEYHYVVSGIVEQVGKVDSLSSIFSDHYTLNEVLIKEGDKVLVRWWAVATMYEVKPNMFRVEYNDIIGIIRDGELIPVNGNVIYKGAVSGGKVVSVANDVKEYEYKGKISVPSPPDVGDYILARAGMEIENVMHQKLNEHLFVCSFNDVYVSSDQDNLEYATAQTKRGWKI